MDKENPVEGGSSRKRMLKKSVPKAQNNDEDILSIGEEVPNPYFLLMNDGTQYGVHNLSPSTFEPSRNKVPNYRTLMDGESDQGELPSRKSSVCSLDNLFLMGRQEPTPKPSPTYQTTPFVLSIPPLEMQISPISDAMIKSQQAIKSVSEEEKKPRTKVLGYCNCKRSKCMKLYCECFSMKRKCTSLCGCHSCSNTKKCNKQTVRVKYQREDEEIICSCRKSKCRKKYCECYSRGQTCSALCKCIDCNN